MTKKGRRKKIIIKEKKNQNILKLSIFLFNLSFFFLKKILIQTIYFCHFESQKGGSEGHCVTSRLLQKDVSENFDFRVTLQHHQSYKLDGEHIFLMITH